MSRSLASRNKSIISIVSSSRRDKTPDNLNLPEKPQSSVIVRDVDGSISYWDNNAEQNYGFSKWQAEGNVSHNLLKTVFPYPLRQINDQLLSRNVWEGELIHTVRDGSRVKVLSRWELCRDAVDNSFRVREVNTEFLPINPDESHLAIPAFSGKLVRLGHRLIGYLPWLLLPAIFVLGVFAFLTWFTHSTWHVPL